MKFEIWNLSEVGGSGGTNAVPKILKRDWYFINLNFKLVESSLNWNTRIWLWFLGGNLGVWRLPTRSKWPKRVNLKTSDRKMKMTLKCDWWFINLRGCLCLVWIEILDFDCNFWVVTWGFDGYQRAQNGRNGSTCKLQTVKMKTTLKCDWWFVNLVKSSLNWNTGIWLWFLSGNLGVVTSEERAGTNALLNSLKRTLRVADWNIQFHKIFINVGRISTANRSSSYPHVGIWLGLLSGIFRRSGRSKWHRNNRFTSTCKP